MGKDIFKGESYFSGVIVQLKSTSLNLSCNQNEG